MTSDAVQQPKKRVVDRAVVAVPEEVVERVRAGWIASGGRVGSGFRVRPLEGASAPGLALWRISDDTGLWRAVVDDGERILRLPPDTIRRVLQAWGYGADRTVTAARFASVIGALESGDGTAVLDLLSLQDAPQKWRDRVTLPRELEVDGRPAVEYWVTAGEPPLWRSTIIVGADGEHEHRRETIWELE